MKNVQKPLFMGIIGIVCLAPCMFSQSTMTLTGAGSNVLAGVYIGPYYATVDGQANVPIICDDFSDESSIGETWQANVTNVSSNAPTMLSQRLNLGGAQSTDYSEASYLAQQLMGGATCPPGATCSQSDYAGDIQFAIWQIFDPGGNPMGQLSGSDATNAASWLNYAQTHAPSISSDSNVLVYSPVNGGPPQEFLGVMPEAGAPFFWAIDLLGLAALVFYGRRRRTQNVPVTAYR